MELGLEYTDKMALPPRLPLWKLVGYCIPECTRVVSKILYCIGLTDIPMVFCYIVLMSMHVFFLCFSVCY